MAAWCEANECTREQLKYWLYKKKSAALSVVSATPPRFVPLAVTEESKNSFAATPTLTIHIGAAWIPLQSGFDPSLLREVMRALDPSC
jgi:hypothetical protein